jgi:hypothetical protein
MESENMLIGLSLSYCVADIINGLVNIDDVAFIVAGTRIRDAADLSDVLDSYARNYWSNLPQLGRSIATQLYEEGKVIQPRVLGLHAYHVADGHWARVTRDI